MNQKDDLYMVVPYFNFYNNNYRENNLKDFLNKYKNLNNLKIILVEGISDNLYGLEDLSKELFKHIKYNCTQKIWVKENLINLGIKNCLPTDWKYVSWVDADVIFVGKKWVDKTLNALKNFDVVQMFDLAFLLDMDGLKINKIDDQSKIFEGFHLSYFNLKENSLEVSKALDKPIKDIYGCTGYAWAITRDFYNKIGKLWDYNIVGGGDTLIVDCIDNKDFSSPFYSEKFKTQFLEYKRKFQGCKASFIKQNIVCRWHGSTKSKAYAERHTLLKNSNFDASQIGYNEYGVIFLKDEKTTKNIEHYMFSRETFNKVDKN